MEREYRLAIEIARDQEAKWLELRAAGGLSRLLRDQGRGHDTHDALRAIYGWFTEGFDTPDVIAAKVLLEETS